MTANTKIVPRDSGPLVVMAPPLLRDHKGTEIETKDVAALCRFGKSANKPFSDGTHYDAGWREDA